MSEKKAPAADDSRAQSLSTAWSVSIISLNVLSSVSIALILKALFLSNDKVRLLDGVDGDVFLICVVPPRSP